MTTRAVNVAIGAGLLAGLALGASAAALDSPALRAVAAASAPLGDLFVRAIRMVVIPLVVTTVFEGVARLGQPGRVGRLGGGAIAFFWLTTLPAIAIGMAVTRAATALAPDVPPPDAGGAAAPDVPGLVETLVELVPANPLQAAVEGRLLPVLVFTVLFAAAAATLPAERREPLVELAGSAGDALIRLVRWILWTAPVGVFGLAAPAAATMGPALLGSLAVFVVSVIAGLALLLAAIYMPAVVFLGRMEPGRFVRGTAAGAMVGFGTTSSMAALPVLLESAEDDLGLPAGPAGIVLSLGAAMNRAGSALFQGAAVVFLAFLFQVEMGPTTVVAAALATFLASLTVAPIPSASVFTLAPALAAAGVPLAGLGLLLGIDRVPDMFRSAVNQVGHMAAAVVVARRVHDPGAPGPDSGP